MAVIVRDMPKVKHRGRSPVVYPEEWFDGQIRKLVRDVDFKGKPRSFQATLRNYGYARHLKLIVRTMDESLFIQFTPYELRNGEPPEET